MLPSIAASSSGHWNQDGSRRWQRVDAAVGAECAPRRRCRRGSPRPAPAPSPAAGRVAARGSARRAGAARICSISARLCSTSRMRIQTRALTSPACSTGTSNCELVVGRVAGRAARVEVAARGAADIAAGGELPRERRLTGCRCRRCGPAARRCRRRARPARESAGARRRPARAAARCLRRARSTRDAAGHDAIHHQPVAEARRRRAQHLLAQHAAVRVHEREGGVVADRADVAEVVGEPLELGHRARAATRRAAAPRRRARPRPPARRRAHRRRCCRRRRGRRAAPRARAARPPSAPRCPCAT